MLSPFTLSFMAGLSAFLIVMGILRPQGSIFAATSTDSLLDTLELKLKKAGITSISPSVVLLAGAATMGIVFLVGLFATGNIVVGLLFSLLVPVVVSFDLDRRARKWQEKLIERLVPFLRKIESQVRAGQNPVRAFAVAASEDKLLAWVLREQLANLQLNRPFREVLEDTLTVMPIRPWVQFVRSMDAFAEAGGQLAEILSSNVERINSQVLLRQRLMGDVAQFRGQQIVIMCFAVVIPTLLFLSARDVFGTLFNSPAGIVALIVAILMDIFALKVTQAAVNDVERRLEA